VWRKTAIIDAGGWQAETLTEDLDLSYRAFLRGWKAHYVRDVEAPAELPVSFSAFRQQQHRWARGSLECARKLLPEVWNASLPLPTKLEATLHLTGYAVHLLLFALVLLYPLVVLLSQRYPQLISLFGIAFMFNATAFAPTTLFVFAQSQLGRRWWVKLPAIFFLTAFGSGMMVNTLRAAVQAFSDKDRVFKRTPKFGIVEKGQRWVRHRYQLRLDPIVYLEFGLAMVNFGTAILALQAGNWIIGLYAAIFCFGLLFTSGMSVIQSLAVYRSDRQNIQEPQRLSAPLKKVHSPVQE
jgi:cellulose synthase/poly-beta-1,6-N-acetylglucosamine synthase-like glycosyltransferase